MMMSRSGKYGKSYGLLIIVLVLLNIVIVLISARYYTLERNRLKHEVTVQLQGIADLKADQLVDWRNERLADARYLSKSQEISLYFSILSGDPQDKAALSKLLGNLKAMFLNGKYEAMLAVDGRGKCFSALPDSTNLVAEVNQDEINKADLSDSIVMGDFILGKDSKVILQISVPVMQANSTAYPPSGWILLKINPGKDLLRLLGAVPNPSKSLAVELVRRDKHDVIHLGRSGLFRTKAAMPANISGTSDSSTLYVDAGFSGTTESIDFRGKSVLVATRPIQGSRWYLAIEMESSEAFAELKKIKITTALFSMLLIVSLTSSIVLFWMRQRGEVKNLALKQRLLSEQFDWLSTYANDAILLYNNRMEILKVNDKAIELYGYTEPELMGMSLTVLTGDEPDGESKNKYNDSSVIGGGRYETVHKRKDGASFPVEVSTRLVETPGGSCYQSIIRDLTERKKIEKALVESEERMRMITNSLPQIVWTARPDGHIDYVNSRFEALTGLLPFKGDSLRNAVHPDDLERITTEWNAAVKDNIPRQFEVRLRMKDGSFHWFINMGMPLYDQNGEIIKWFGSATDIDNLKSTEQELYRRELLLRNAVNNLPSSFTVYDDKGRIEYINDFSLILSDVTAEQAIGKREEEIFPEVVTRNYLSVLYNTYKTKEPQVIECLVNYSDAPRFLIYHFVPTLDENNNIYKVLGMAYDITDRKNSEEKLRVAIRKAEEWDRLKSAFLANISHEIRTPLNAIMGFSQMIQKNFINDDQLNGYVDIIMASAEQLLDIIKQIIEISQMESGGLSVNFAAFRLNDLMNELYQEYCLHENHRIKSGLKFILEADPDFQNEVIDSDRDKLGNILRNLIGNAFKFTRENGTISYGYKVLSPTVLQFFVRDTGIGIDESKIDLIFDSFRQGDETFTRNFGGVGLGLTICRNLVNKLGGKIWVESKKNSGSIFYFTLPLNKS